MSNSKVVLISNGGAVYAVPTDVCEKHALEGVALKNAIKAMADRESDVEGQEALGREHFGRKGRERSYGNDTYVYETDHNGYYGPGEWVRID